MSYSGLPSTLKHEFKLLEATLKSCVATIKKEKIEIIFPDISGDLIFGTSFGQRKSDSKDFRSVQAPTLRKSKRLHWPQKGDHYTKLHYSQAIHYLVNMPIT